MVSACRRARKVLRPAGAAHRRGAGGRQRWRPAARRHSRSQPAAERPVEPGGVDGLGATGGRRLLDPRDRDAFGQAQPHHQQLHQLRLARPTPRAAPRRAPRPRPGQPALRHALRAGRQLCAPQGQPAMGAGADADIVAVAPVDEIVARFLPGPGMVADLVGRQPGSAEHLLGQLVELGLQVLVERHQLALLDHGVEAGARLDGQLIERQMPVGMAERPAAARPAKPPRSARGGHRSGRTSGAGRSRPPSSTARQRLGHVCARGRESAGRRSSSAWTPSETRFTPAAAKAAKPLGLDRGRVGLQRDLDVGGERPAVGRAVDDRRHRRGLHQRRRAAAEEDRAQRAARRQRREMVELGHQRPGPAPMVDAAADMAVEVAIGAFGLAERPVDVEREAARPLDLAAKASVRGHAMIDHISLPVSDYARSRAFYDKALGALGFKVAMEITDCAGLHRRRLWRAGLPEPAFWIGAAARTRARHRSRPRASTSPSGAGPGRSRRLLPAAAGRGRHATTAPRACGRTTIPATTRPSSSTRTAIGSRRSAIGRSSAALTLSRPSAVSGSDAGPTARRASVRSCRRLHRRGCIWASSICDGGLGRRFGSLGLTIEGLATVASSCARVEVEGEGERRAVPGDARPAQPRPGACRRCASTIERRSRLMPAWARVPSWRWRWAPGWRGLRATRQRRARGRRLLQRGAPLGHRHRRLRAWRLHPRRRPRRGRRAAAGHRASAFPDAWRLLLIFDRDRAGPARRRRGRRVPAAAALHARAGRPALPPGRDAAAARARHGRSRRGRPGHRRDPARGRRLFRAGPGRPLHQPGGERGAGLAGGARHRRRRPELLGADRLRASCRTATARRQLHREAERRFGTRYANLRFVVTRARNRGAEIVVAG